VPRELVERHRERLELAVAAIAGRGFWGALTASVHSTRPDVLTRAEVIAVEVGVPLSENLTDGVYVNQSAAFSDFHATGLEPAATASFTDDAFVTPRFHVAQWRRHLPVGE